MPEPVKIDVEALSQSMRGYLRSFPDDERRAEALADFIGELIERMRAEQGEEAAREFRRAARAMLERMADEIGRAR